jgi:ubiquinone/menaquinone biosynthesis C-methylase UbiE
MEEFLKPEEVLNNLKIKKDLLAVEFGCGAGGFAIALAKRLEEGEVFAIDIQEAPLSALKSRAELAGVKNIKTLLSDLEREKGSTLPDNYLDLVLIPNLLFQVKEKTAIIKEAKRILKEGGEILIVDWLPEASLGPAEGRVSSKEIKKIGENLGLKLKKEFLAGKYHWGLIFEK